MVFFVLLAVLVLGFSSVIFQTQYAIAAKTGLESPPAPGTPYNQLPAAWQNALYNVPFSTWNPLGSSYQDVVAKGMPTTPVTYGALLKQVGGYTATEADKAGQQYISNFTNSNTYTGTDKELYDAWKQGQGWDRPTYNYVTAPIAQTTLSAGTAIVNAIDTAVLKVVIGVLGIIAYFCKWLIEVGARTLDLTLSPSLYNFTNSELIVKGWTMVRDICNLFFLLVLLFVAICTILKIEKYHAKKTLLTLIIMALLINFSKPIAIFIFDGSQLLMNFFLSQMSGTTGGGGSNASSIYMNSTKIANTIYGSLPPNGGTAEIAVNYLFTVVFLFMLAVAFFVIAIFFIIRIVVIMLLIIVSPFAFFAAIVPDFSKMSSQWWSSLFEYSYYGPAAAFFLLLATNLENAIPKLQPTADGNSSITVILTNILHYLTTLIFLYASIFMAKKFGGGAGAAVVGNANKVMKWAGKGAAMAPYRATAWGAKATGVPGAVTQRLQQSRLGRLFTKEGREEALEEREAAIAEKIGVKGAKARQTRKRAEKYKKEGYSKEALQQMVARGDTAAGLRLAEDGDMDDADYAKLAVNFKGKEDPIKKLIDGKLKEKRLDVLINYRINKEAKGTDGSINADKANDIAREEIGKLNPSKWRDQDMQKMLGFNEKGEETQSDNATLARRGMVKEIYNKLDNKGRAKTTDDMSGSKYAAFKAAVIPPPPATPQPATPPPDVPWS